MRYLLHEPDSEHPGEVAAGRLELHLAGRVVAGDPCLYLVQCRAARQRTARHRTLGVTSTKP